jgi:broad specificity phosphatase PhoE
MLSSQLARTTVLVRFSLSRFHTRPSRAMSGTAPNHNTKKGFNAAVKNPNKNPALMHLLFIRHAESSNNVLAEQITAELGINPYGPHAGADVMAEYDKRRLCDPHLSALGEAQASLLPKHPHLLDLHFDALSQAGRVRVITSPMKRAILTSIPMIKTYKLPRAQLVADMCEKGGSYTSIRDASGAPQNKADPGLNAAELDRLYHATHDSKGIREDGWWHTTCVGSEDNEAFEERLQRAKAWIENEVEQYAKDPSNPDYMVIVSHADFIDSMLTKLLQLQNHAKYVFYSSNTAISHVEFEVRPDADGKKQSPWVRIRGTNIKPVSVSTHELPLHHDLVSHAEKQVQ